jgi:hypothetical protein
MDETELPKWKDVTSDTEYRLKDDHSVTCQVKRIRDSLPGRAYWYELSCMDERLHGYTVTIPDFIFANAFEEVAMSSESVGKTLVVDHPGMCENCFYSWWKHGEPVTPDPCDQRTLNNGGCGECRRHSPSPEGMRKFPVVFPNDGCGDFMERKTK